MRRNRVGIRNPRVRAALAEMGVTDDDIRGLQSATSQADGDKRLSALKERCKKGFRDKALELHPDRTGNDPEKADEFKWYKSVYEGFLESRFRYRPRRQPLGHYPFRVYPYNTSSSTTSSAFDIHELMRQMAMQNYRDIMRNRTNNQAEILRRMRMEQERLNKEARAAAEKRHRQAKTMDDLFSQSSHGVYPDKDEP